MAGRAARQSAGYGAIGNALLITYYNGSCIFDLQ